MIFKALAFWPKFALLFLLGLALNLQAASADYFSDFQAESYDSAFRGALAKALNDNPRAQFVVGEILLYGHGNSIQDIPKAINFLRLSSKNGYFGASEKLGKIYDDGEFIVRDPETALSFFQIAKSDGATGVEEKILSLTVEVHGKISSQSCVLYSTEDVADPAIIARCIEEQFIEGAASLFWLQAYDDGDLESLTRAVPYLLNENENQFAPSKLIERLEAFYDASNNDLSGQMDRAIVNSAGEIKNTKDQHRLGKALFDIERESKFWVPLFESASKDRPAAALDLAKIYDDGKQLDQNKEEALKYYKLAEAGGMNDLKLKIQQLLIEVEGATSKNSCATYGKNDRTRAKELSKCVKRGFIDGDLTRYLLWRFEDGEKSALIQAMPEILLENPVQFEPLLEAYLVRSSQAEQKTMSEELQRYERELFGTPSTSLRLGKILIEKSGEINAGKFLLDWSINGGEGQGAVYLMRLYAEGLYTVKDIDQALRYSEVAQKLGEQTDNFMLPFLEEKDGKVSPKTCPKYDTDSEDPSVIAKCIENGYLAGDSTLYWLEAFDSGVMEALNDALRSMDPANPDNNLLMAIAKKLPKFAINSTPEQNANFIQTVNSMGFVETDCEEKKDAMNFVVQGNVSACMLLAHSGNPKAVEKAIEFWKNGSTELGINQNYAGYLFETYSKQEAEESGCLFVLKQLETNPKKHLQEAKNCLAENEFLNKGIVGQAVSLQIKALVGDDTQWGQFFSSADDAVWVLENVNWNKLNPDLVSEALYFLDGKKSGDATFQQESIRENKSKLIFEPEWMSVLKEKSKPLASAYLKRYLQSKEESQRCNALTFATKNEDLYSDFVPIFADALADCSQSSSSNLGDLLTTSKNDSQINSQTKLNNSNNLMVSNQDMLILATEFRGNIEEQCPQFGRYLENRSLFRDVVSKEMWPESVVNEKDSIELCKKIDGKVASFEAKRAYDRQKYDDAFNSFSFGCEQRVFEACGWAAHILMFKTTKKKKEVGFNKAKEMGIDMAQKGWDGGDPFSGAILFDLLNTGTFSNACAGNSVCPGDQVLEDLLEQNSPAGTVRVAYRCVNGKGDILTKVFTNGLSQRTCYELCKDVEKLVKSGALDSVSLEKARKMRNSKRCNG